jgi:hypothetical protein
LARRQYWPADLQLPANLKTGQTTRTRFYLNGEWDLGNDGELYDTALVPSSRRPSGYYTLSRNLVMPSLTVGQHIRFEAITYWGFNHGE